MEAIRQIVRIPKDHEIGIKIPQYVPENETVEVILIIKKMPDSFKQKIEELKEAVRDNLFLDDLMDVSEDFITVDSERYVLSFNLMVQIHSKRFNHYQRLGGTI